ncbi:hypothetical protein QN277_026647 [Acacia crassicarpa]|uniref:Uncharacterized protein n=1 Tax=Acacia crassicarpa TaxID=499986 RepID=A0AAE1J8B2_9FABA|nr:hypothetical protein QN277_026647 [Acacia crassicarpa]
MGRKPCCDKEGVNRGTWSVIEDGILSNFIKLHGEGKWRDIPKRAGLNRCGKSCRLRWLNYLRPDIKRGNFSEAEEDLIIRLHNLLGNRWSLIAGRLPGRTDNEIKNFWNTNLSKRAHQDHPQNNKPCHPFTTKSPTTLLTSAHHQPSPVIRAKPFRCTKKIIFTESNGGINSVTRETQNNTTASTSDTARVDDLMGNDCFSSYGVIEDFDFDGLLIPQQVPEINIDDEEANELKWCDEDEANNLTHQNWLVGQLFESAEHNDDVDISFLNLQSDSFMDLDPSCLDGKV